MANRVIHGTTTANTAANVSLAGTWPKVTVLNRGGGDLFVTTDGSAPTVNGDDVSVVPVNQQATFSVPANATWEQGSGAASPSGTAIKIISTAAVTYSVVGTAG